MIIEKNVKTLIKTHEFIDPWFPTRYSFSPFSGCQNTCPYCLIGQKKTKKIIYKKNWKDLLISEIKNIPPNSFIGIGGGTSELYQHELKKDFNYSELYKILCNKPLTPYLYTGSASIQKDLPLLSQISKNKAIIVIRFASFLTENQQKLEDGLGTLNEKIQTLKIAKQLGLKTGIILGDIIPFINDTHEEITTALTTATKLKVDFISIKFLSKDTLQKLSNIFSRDTLDVLKDQEKYRLFKQEKKIIFEALCQEKNIFPRPASTLYKDHLSPKDLSSVILANIYYYLKSNNKQINSFKHAAFRISSLSDKEFYSYHLNNNLLKINGIGEKTEKILRKIYLNNDLSYIQDLERNFFKASNKS